MRDQFNDLLECNVKAHVDGVAPSGDWPDVCVVVGQQILEETCSYLILNLPCTCHVTKVLNSCSFV